MGFWKQLFGMETLDLQTTPPKPEEPTLPIVELAGKRMERFEKAMGKLSIPVDIHQWASGMIKRKGLKVRVWQDVVEWPLALMIVRYGQDPDKWPLEFSPVDIARARQWAASGETPAGVQYITEEK